MSIVSRKRIKATFLWITLLCVVTVFCQQQIFANKLQGKIEHWSLNYNPTEVIGEKNLTALTELAAEYMKLHPGVEITIVKKPRMSEAEINTWIVTQCAAGTIPEIIWAHSSEIEQYAPEGWFVNWMPYLNEPNPYIPGNKRWFDTFYQNPVKLRMSPDGSLWSLPVDLVATIIYYNADIFMNVGINAPMTWDEFMAIQKKLKNAGYTPFLFAMGNSINTSWIYRILLSHFYENKLADMDVLGTPGYVDAEEFSRAFKKGIFTTKAPEYKEILRLVKEWSQFWNRNYFSIPYEQVRDRFVRKEGVMAWAICREMRPLLEDPLRDFKLGTFYCPQVTKRTSKYSTEKPMRMVGGAAGEQWAITVSAIRDKEVDLCVDWIRFLTTPENNAKLVLEAKALLPIIKGCEVPDVLRPFLPQFEAGVSPFIVERFLTRKQYDEWFRSMQMFVAGNLTLEQTAEMHQTNFEKSVEGFIEKFNYDQTRW